MAHYTANHPTTLLALFASQVARSADAPAVGCGERALSYTALDALSDGLARRLLAEPLPDKARVGVFVDRSIEMVVALLGVLKAGLAYVPLDPEQPAARLRGILKDSGADRVVSQSHLAAALAPVTEGEVPVLFIDRAPTRVDGSVPLPTVSADALAYVIYTSGSTGAPKGVMVSHGALAGLLCAMADGPGLAAGETLLAVTTYGFDIAAFELFGPLIVGARCVIAPRQAVTSGEQLGRLIAACRPDLMQATPAAWWMLYRAGWSNPERIRALCGGEALPPALAEQFLRTDTRAWNLYGPTEATVWASADLVAAHGSVTIGRPLANSAIYIVDEGLTPVPDGATGEIAIAGEGLADGYWNRPALTAERFPTPGWLNGERLYRTGDQGRIGADGRIEFLGRLDDQIKLRGYRIEPAEIEASLATHPALAQCAVVLTSLSGHEQLTAFCVPAPGATMPDFRHLRQHLATRLPEYMIPIHYIELGALPLNANRKVDRRALAARRADDEPQHTVPAPPPDATTAASARIEARILALWGEALGIEGIRSDDGFFDVGGDSVLAVTIVEQLQAECGVVFDVVDLFDYPNARALAQHLARQVVEQAPAPVTPSPAPVTPSPAPVADHPSEELLEGAVAIIGISCRFPGAADHTQFWQNLLDGVESVERLSLAQARAMGVSERVLADPKYVPVRATIADKACFDPGFFNLSRRDAERIDPQVRLLLQHAWNAVEDAGYEPRDLTHTGVIATTSQTAYPLLGREGDTGAVFEDYRDYQDLLYAQSGTLPTLIAYKLGLRGPCYAVQSNCSSSLLALDQACAGIQRGDASSYLVAAASVFPRDLAGYVHQDGLNFSSDGHLKAFDAEADGMVSGEGVAVLLVKSAPLAVADGDAIYALITGSAANNDGAAKPGFYVPSAAGQADVIKRAQRRAGVDVRTIRYVEAHGTGTQLGDPVEVKALRDAFAAGGATRGQCAIGSVKSNIGHLDAAAGLAGVIKTALGLAHGKMPPTINYHRANERLNLDGSPFTVAARTMDLAATGDGPCCAAVSSFGIGGTNAHVILQRWPSAPPEATGAVEHGPLAFLLSAKTPERLRERASALLAAIDDGHVHGGNLVATAYTLQVGRRAMEARLAILADSVVSLSDALTAYRDGVWPIGNVWVTELDPANAEQSEASAVMEQGVDGAARLAVLRDQLHQWSRGGRVDWAALYHGVRPGRRHLPGYPFARERYWIASPTANDPTAHAAQGQPPDATRDGPLAALPTPGDQVLGIVVGDHLPDGLGDYLAQVRMFSVEPWSTADSVRARLDRIGEVEHILCLPSGRRTTSDLGGATPWRAVAQALTALGYGETALHWTVVRPPAATPALAEADVAAAMEAARSGSRWTRCAVDWPTSAIEPAPGPGTPRLALGAGARCGAPYPVAADGLRNYALDDTDDLLEQALIVTLQTLGLGQLNGKTADQIQMGWRVQPAYGQWLEATLNALAERGRLVKRDARYWANAALDGVDGAQVQARWDERKTAWSAYPDRMAVAELTQSALEALPAILRGARRATEVLFPGGSMDRIAALYTDNPVADYFNEAVAAQVESFWEDRRDRGDAAGLRILEVGAGTGGTSARIFARFQERPDAIACYCYTDLSQGFLHHARQRYGAVAPYLDTRILNIEHPPEAQGFDPAGFDLVVAANVLHATRDLRETLRHCQWLLAEDGCLLLNEMTANSLFSLVVFGLLDGWWRFADAPLRLAGSPVVSANGWRALLADEGFSPVAAPTAHAAHLGQQVFVARGDGRSRARAAVVDTRPAAPRAATVAADRADDGLYERIVARLVADVAEQLKFPVDEIDTAVELSRYGFDSIGATQWVNRFNDEHQLSLSPAVLFQYPSIDRFARFLADVHGVALRSQLLGREDDAPLTPGAAGPTATAAPALAPLRRGEGASRLDAPIAIVGMSGRFPGADSVAAFWDNLLNGRNGITEIPASRWRWQDRYGDPRAEPGKTNVRAAGFMAGVADFDAAFFGIDGDEAARMEPQQRLLMQHVWNVIEDAGYPASALAGRRVALFVGAGIGEYTPMLLERGVDMGQVGLFGLSPSAAPNRISHLLDLTGPSCAIDTACSSSLVAVHRGCQAIRHEGCEAAIVAGVNTLLTPALFVGYAAAGLLSPEARCKTFAATADGFARGEGVGVLLLKPLDRAVEDGDNIYGVIRGSSENHGGRAQSWVAPNPGAQAESIQAAYRQAGIDPRGVDFIEAHGTGTLLGDSIEVEALKQAFAAMGDDGHAHCALGTAKTLVGHLEFAAGVTGVIKAVLQLRHRTLIAGHPGEALNPHLRLEESPFYLSKRTQPWPTPKARDGDTTARRAGVSAFGIGGVNAHVLLEEYAVDRAEPPPGPLPPQPIVLSAKNAERLRERMAELREALDTGAVTEGDFESLCYTLQCGRDAMASRIGLKAGSIDELRALLAALLDGAQTPASVWRGDVERTSAIVQWFTVDEELREAVRRWTARRKVDRLLDAWVKGVPIDWSALYGERPPRRLSLPGYPFARDRHWALDALPEAAPAPSPRAAASALPLPTGSVLDVQFLAEELVEVSASDGGLRRPMRLLCVADRPETVSALAAQADRVCCQWLPGPGEATGEVLEAHFRHALERAVDGQDPFDAVLYLCGLETDGALRRFDAIAALLRALDARRIAADRVLLCAAVGSAEQTAYADAWLGFERGLGHREVSVLRFDDAPPGHGVTPRCLVAGVLDGLGAPGRASAVYRDGRRFAYRVRRVHVPVAAVDPLDATRSVLVTGGCGGVGYALATHLAGRYRANLMLLGRRAADAQIDAKLAALRAFGIRATYLSADVADFSDVRKQVEQAEQAVGALTGIIHAAGVHAPAPLAEKTLAQFTAVLRPKVAGTLTVEALARERELGFVVLLSSSAAVVGDLGACDYAVANRFVSSYGKAFAETVDARVLAVQWGMWDGLGMAAFDDEAQRQMLLRTTGQTPIPVADCLRAFDALLARPPSSPVLVLAPDSPAPDIAPISPTAQAAATTPAPAESVRDALIAVIAAASGRPAQAVDPDAVFADFGIDSATALSLTEQLSHWVGETLSPTVFFAHPTIERLAGYLKAAYPHLRVPGDAGERFVTEAARATAHDALEQPTTVAPTAHPESMAAAESPRPPTDRPRPQPAPSTGRTPDTGPAPLAIVGISGRFPAARSVDAFWRILASGQDATGPIERSVDGTLMNLLGLNFSHNGQPYRAGLVPGIDEFDPLFFEIAPREADRIDPRQRLLLQEAWRALEDAGVGPGELAARTTGVYVGVEEGDYKLITGAEGTLTASHDGILAGRIGYFLNTHGPVVSINTACSSGLVAFHQACVGLRAGDCDTALVGGVNLLTTPLPIEGMRATGMLSPSGVCRAFDRDADGMVPAEGVVVLVVKRLSDALDDGDVIQAIVAGSGVNYDGRSNGITAPNEQAQAALLRQVYQRHRIDPEALDYLIAHGTGTPLGDPIEIRAINAALGGDGAGRRCWIGSVKTNAGHAMAASGLVSVVAMVESMRHNTIPASINVANESDYFDWGRSRFRVATRSRQWTAPPGQARTGAVSAFGMSGTNAHVVLAAHEPPARPALDPPRAVLIGLTAKTPEALRDVAQLLRAHIDTEVDDGAALVDVAYTLLCCRHHFTHRCAFVVGDRAEALAALDQFLDAGVIDAGSVGSAKRDAGTAAPSLIAHLSRLGEAPPPTPDALGELTQAFCDGTALDWGRCPALSGGRKRRLPTYPFARERHWAVKRVVADPGAGGGGVARAADPGAHDGTPVYRSKVRIDPEFAHIRDHAARGVPVVPGAAFLALSAAAWAGVQARRSGDGHGEAPLSGCVFRSPRWQRPVPLLGDSATLGVWLTPTGEEEDYEARVALGADPALGETCFRTRLTGALVPRPVALALGEVRRQCDDRRVDGEALYAGLAAQGLDLGPAYRSVERVCAARVQGCWQAVADIVVAERDADARVGDTRLLYLSDAALQAAAWIATLDGRADRPPPVMVAADRVAVWSGLGDRGVAWLRQSGEACLNIDVCAPDGRVWMQWRGVAFRANPVERTRHGGSARAVDPAAAETTPESPTLLLAERLKTSLAAHFGLAPDRLALDAPLDVYGVDSVSGMEWLVTLELDFGTLPQTVLSEHGTLSALADALSRRYPQAARVVVAQGLQCSDPARPTSPRSRLEGIAAADDRSNGLTTEEDNDRWIQ